MMRSLIAVLAAVPVIFGAACTRLQAAVPVVWDGSDTSPDHHVIAPGYLRWEEGNWTKDGTPGQTAQATMGDNTGGRGGLDIVLGGGAKVFHDQNDGGTDPGALSDFKPRMDQNGPGSLTIKEGSVLWLDAHTDLDGRWARMDIDVNLDNGILRSTHTPALCPPSECSVSAGRIIFGYNNDLLANTILNWNITNGGRIEMEGKMTWGNPNFWEDPDNSQTGHNPGIGMIMTINDGTLDLTGGNLYDDFFGLVNGELVFFYERIGPVGTSKNETYVINFTGPGQIIVDNGIFVANQDTAGVFQADSSVPDLYTPITFQRLWELGILQASGQSGMTGATFGNFFTTTGSPGMPNYTLTSLIAPPGLPGDYNDDGKVDAADAVVWRNNLGTTNSLPNDPIGGTIGSAHYDQWAANFGKPPGSGSAALGSGAVPEPSSPVLVLLALAGAFARGRGKRGG